MLYVGYNLFIDAHLDAHYSNRDLKTWWQMQSNLFSSWNAQWKVVTFITNVIVQVIQTTK